MLDVCKNSLHSKLLDKWPSYGLKQISSYFCFRFKKPGESADNEPVSKRKFLRPGEAAAETTAPAKSDQPSNRPSWRKAGRTKELK